MTESEELAYVEGGRMAWLSMLGKCLDWLGIDDPATQHVRWISEREMTVATLRRICGEHGDNDWPDDLHLADVIEKHLERYLE